MLDFIKNKAAGRRIVILGFGMEGQTSLKFFKDSMLAKQIIVIDQNPDISSNEALGNGDIPFYGGSDYQEQLNDNDFIIKSPGVKLTGDWKNIKTHSQTSLFLEKFQNQIIGVTGTKGKSTTSTMLYRILKEQNNDALLVGNIGQPAFGLIHQIKPHTLIVYELSAHQLQCISHGPRYAILLNLMPEHLDFFAAEEAYYKSKLNIFQHQGMAAFSYISPSCMKIAEKLAPIHPTPIKSKLTDGKIFINDNKLITSTDLKYLLGKHHIANIHSLVELVLHLELSLPKAIESISQFHPLPHRQELLGEKHGLRFINDSISTIPQSAIQAISAIEKVDYLILGGYDRGIDYSSLITFLVTQPIKKIFFLGEAGRRMLKELDEQSSHYNFEYSVHKKLQDIQYELLQIRKGTILLSPAAASYDAFKNFEERGNFFREIFSKIS